MKRFSTWVRKTLDMLCARPDHLQRIAITGAGLSLYPMMIGLIALLVWFGIKSAALALAVVPILGFALYGFIALFAVVVIALEGTIKGLKLSAPGGAAFEIDMGDPEPDAVVVTQTTTIPTKATPPEQTT